MKMLTIIALVCGMFLTGCKSTNITPDSAYRIGSSAGLATGYFVKMSKLDDSVKNVLASITDELSYAIPTNSQTFAEIWLPIAKNKILIYVEKDNLDASQKNLVDATLIVVVEALDHLFVKNTQFKNSTDLTLSAINGFCKSFKSVLTVNTNFASSIAYDVDSEMYMYLSVKFAK